MIKINLPLLISAPQVTIFTLPARPSKMHQAATSADLQHIRYPYKHFKHTW